jgi:hypothetical protein
MDEGVEMVSVPREQWEAIEARLAGLERRSAGESHQLPPNGGDRRTDRRGLLKHGAMLAAGAVAGGAGLVAAQATPAAAANGDPLTLGSTSNTATAATELTVTGSAIDCGIGVFDSSSPGIAFGDESAVFGHAKATAFLHGVTGYAQGNMATGVVGITDEYLGVWGQATTGTAVYALATGTGGVGVGAVSQAGVGITAQGGICALQLQSVGNPPPSSRTDLYGPGSVDVDDNDMVWICTAQGTPGTWVRLAGPGTAGAFSVLPTSVRVYDSRPGEPPTAVGPKSPLVGGTARSIDITANSSGVPSSANAVLVNLTAVPRTRSGWLSAYKFGISWPGTSTLNWSATGNPIANSAVVAMSSGKINLFANAAADVILDVIGYYQ